MAEFEIREATPADWANIHPIFSEVVDAGRAYAYDPAWSFEEARDVWMSDERVVVATLDERLVGTAKMGANRPGRGAHIATASFMVAADNRGLGVGRRLGEYVIEWARASGFRGIQFNAVVETNAPAVHLWQSLGFEVIGTVPGSFEHPEHGFVGLHVMYLDLSNGQ